jgi:hypothetical protein
MGGEGRDIASVGALQDYEGRSYASRAQNIAGLDHCTVRSSHTLPVHQCPIARPLWQAKLGGSLGVKLTGDVGKFTQKD